MLTTTIIVSVVIILLVAVSYLINLVIKQKRNLNRYEGIHDVEAEQERIRVSIEQEQKEAQEAINSLNSQQNYIQSQISDDQKTLDMLKKELTVVQDTADIQSFGLYEPKYDFGTSAEYKEKLDEIRAKQKSMIREKTAIICSSEWTIYGNRTKGRQMTDRQIKLMARAFNGECDSIIPKVRYIADFTINFTSEL